MRPSRTPTARAFTLLELVITLGIIAVLAGIAVPRLSAGSASYRIEAATARLLTDVNAVSERARVTSRGHVIRFDLDADSYTIYEGIDPNDRVEIQVVRLRSNPYRCRITQAMIISSPYEMQFLGRGPFWTSGRVSLQSGGLRRSIDFAGNTGEIVSRPIEKVGG